MDEWAVRAAVMKAGLGGEESESEWCVRVCVGGGNMKGKKCMQTEGSREIKKSNERWKRQREQDGEGVGRGG